jgi:hypothetical protein
MSRWRGQRMDRHTGSALEAKAYVKQDEFPTGVFVHAANASWELQFNDDGTYLFFVDDVVDATGIYSISGDLYIDTTDHAPCKHARNATYRWTLDGLRLTFQLVGKEHCSPRRNRLDGTSWIRRLRLPRTARTEQISQNLDQI